MGQLMQLPVVSSDMAEVVRNLTTGNVTNRRQAIGRWAVNRSMGFPTQAEYDAASKLLADASEAIEKIAIRIDSLLEDLPAYLSKGLEKEADDLLGPRPEPRGTDIKRLRRYVDDLELDAWVVEGARKRIGQSLDKFMQAKAERDVG